ncbi:MAG: NAD(P)(+) transhydrogenase (Re/Si-specific) subunit beta [Planctomycetota bacterium]
MSFLVTLIYLAAGVAFIVGLKMLGKTHTARRGNLVSAGGMALAVLGTVLSIYDHHRGDFSLGQLQYIAIGVVLGTLVGIPAARMVKMTAMPEMVALFNGFGGIASLLVGWSQVHVDDGWTGTADGFTLTTVYLAVLIGGVTFTGSLIAYAKLAEKITSKPGLYAGQNLVNALVLLAAAGLGVWFVYDPQSDLLFLVGTVLALFLGVAAVIPIGGADMPVVISLLNSYSGLAACAAGFAVSNTLLITTGALVGASGIILTNIMCKAMNRSLANVLFSGFGSGATTRKARVQQGEAKPKTPEDAYYILEAARSVVFIPGYGMAVAQAQHAVKEFADLLERNGCEVRYAIHPVAGRMPGHMNVLLAEANVPYEQLVEMDTINPIMENMDVAIVIGANDVVNPDAREDETSPIYGMPIIDADKARTVFILKRSMASGFAGIENPLFFKENSYMVFGDAKKTMEALIGEFKSAVAA